MVVQANELAREVDADACIVLEVGWGEAPPGPRIPGSIYLDTDRIEAGPPFWRLLPDDELSAAFGERGLRASDRIVVVSRSAIAAARVLFTLQYLGAEDVRILDGGPAAWVASGLPTVREHAALPLCSFGGTVRPELRASMEEVDEVVERGHAWLVDVRSEAEFRGEVSGYRSIEARGRIPGSIHAGDADDQGGIYVRPDGRLLPPAEIAAHWARCGLTLAPNGDRFERDVIFVCGGGWRASLAYLYAQRLGLRNAKVFSEGWIGWSAAHPPGVRVAHEGCTPS